MSVEKINKQQHKQNILIFHNLLTLEKTNNAMTGVKTGDKEVTKAKVRAFPAFQINDKSEVKPQSLEQKIRSPSRSVHFEYSL